MKSLVIDCRMINASGIGTYIRNVLPGIIDSKKFKVTCLGKKEELAVFNWFSDTYFIEVAPRILSLYEHLKLPFFIPECDIYWVPNWNIPLLPIKAKKKVITIHDVYHLTGIDKHSFYKIALIKYLINAAANKADLVFTVSEFSKKEILKYINCSKNKIHVTPLSVSDDFDKNFVFRKIEEDYIMCVGNIKPHKNLETAVKAFKKLENKTIKFYVIGKREGFITGSGNHKELLEGWEERIFFTGYVNDNDLKNYYANAKAFIFPSKYEGFGLPVLEAMKFHIPIIASNAASIPEVGGNAIAYFNPYNEDEIAEKIQQVLEGEIKPNFNEYQLQLNKFNWSNTIDMHIEKLNAL